MATAIPSLEPLLCGWTRTLTLTRRSGVPGRRRRRRRTVGCRFLPAPPGRAFRMRVTCGCVWSGTSCCRSRRARERVAWVAVLARRQMGSICGPTPTGGCGVPLSPAACRWSCCSSRASMPTCTTCPRHCERAWVEVLCRVEAALTSLGDIARVHVSRVGDGAEHLHWWFTARPLGLVQARGSFAVEWDDVLPPRPRDEWEADLRRVAEALRR